MSSSPYRAGAYKEVAPPPYIPPEPPVIPETTDDLPEGVDNLYFTEARVLALIPDPPFVPENTDGLPEGLSNLYFTEARVNALLPSDTDELSEGATNKYFTEARVREVEYTVADWPAPYTFVEAMFYIQGLIDAIVIETQTQLEPMMSNTGEIMAQNDGDIYMSLEVANAT